MDPTLAIPPNSTNDPFRGPAEAVFGPFLIGVCANCMLYGIMILQAVIYFVSYKKDPLWIRTFVTYLVFVETVNIGFNIATIYEPLVSRFGTIEALTFFPKAITATPLTNVLISAPAQIFTAWRIIVLTKQKFLGGVIILLALISLAGGIATSVVITIIHEFAKKKATLPYATLWFSTALLCDAMITASLYFSLSRRKTGFKSTDAIVNRIVRLALQTGLLTVTFAISEMITFIIVPNNTTNFALDFPLSKLYTNALLSTLNARLSWRRLGGETADGQTDDNVLFGKQDRDGPTRSTGVSTMTRSDMGRSNRYTRRGETSVTLRNSFELESRGVGRDDLPIQIHKEVIQGDVGYHPESRGNYTQ